MINMLQNVIMNLTIEILIISNQLIIMIIIIMIMEMCYIIINGKCAMLKLLRFEFADHKKFLCNDIWHKSLKFAIIFKFRIIEKKNYFNN